jgi:hypothetical protein
VWQGSVGDHRPYADETRQPFANHFDGLSLALIGNVSAQNAYA